MSNSLFVREISMRDALSRKDDEIRNLVFTHKVLVIRDEGIELDLDGFVGLGKRLGRIVRHPLRNFALSNYRGVIRISNLYSDGCPTGVHDGGTYWHTDMSYKARNLVFTMLQSIRVPSDRSLSATEFIDCMAGAQCLLRAIRTGELVLPDVLQDLKTVQLIHSFGNRDVLSDGGAPNQMLSEEQRASLPSSVKHKLLELHPHNNQLTAYGLAATSTGIDELPTKQSIELLDTLLAFVLDRAPSYLHVYCPGDVVIWDNLSTLHRGQTVPATNNIEDCRLLYRMNLDYSGCINRDQQQHKL